MKKRVTRRYTRSIKYRREHTIGISLTGPEYERMIAHIQEAGVPIAHIIRSRIGDIINPRPADPDARQNEADQAEDWKSEIQKKG